MAETVNHRAARSLQVFASAMPSLLRNAAPEAFKALAAALSLHAWLGALVAGPVLGEGEARIVFVLMRDAF